MLQPQQHLSVVHKIPHHLYSRKQCHCATVQSHGECCKKRWDHSKLPKKFFEGVTMNTRLTRKCGGCSFAGRLYRCYRRSLRHCPDVGDGLPWEMFPTERKTKPDLFSVM